MLSLFSWGSANANVCANLWKKLRDTLGWSTSVKIANEWVEAKSEYLPKDRYILVHSILEKYWDPVKKDIERTVENEHQREEVLRSWLTRGSFEGIWTWPAKAFAIGGDSGRRALWFDIDPKARFIRIGRINREEGNWVSLYKKWLSSKGYKSIFDSSNLFNFIGTNGDNYAKRLGDLRIEANGVGKLPMLGDKRFMDEYSIVGVVFNDLGGRDTYVLLNWSLIHNVRFHE